MAQTSFDVESTEFCIREAGSVLLTSARNALFDGAESFVMVKKAAGTALCISLQLCTSHRSPSVSLDRTEGEYLSGYRSTNHLRKLEEGGSSSSEETMRGRIKRGTGCKATEVGRS